MMETERYRSEKQMTGKYDIGNWSKERFANKKLANERLADKECAAENFASERCASGKSAGAGAGNGARTNRRMNRKNAGRLYIALAMMMLLVLTMALTACAKSNTPTVVVEKQMQQIKDEEVETELSSLVSSSSIAKKHSDDYKKLLAKIQDFDYEVTDEKIDGDSATVKVTITTYDFGKAYKSMITQMEKDANSGKITSSTDMTSYAYKLMFKKFNALEEKDYTKEVEVTCTKNNDGDWETNIIDDSNIEDAILGGVVSAASGN